MNTYHLRFTPYDLSGYAFDWLARYDRFICAEEEYDDEGNPLKHFHMLIVSDNAPNSIRDLAKDRFRIPSGNGRGKNNKYFALFTDWKDPGYICKYNKVLSSKGYSEKELMDFVISGKNKYPVKTEKTPAEDSVTAGSKSKPTAKSPRIPYQQQIISIAYADWINHKKKRQEEGIEASPYDLVEIVCKAMREQSRGINAFLLQDICSAVLFDDPDYRERTLLRLKSKISL